VDDLVLSLASVTSLEGSRLRILVNEEFSLLLLLRRVMDRLHEEDLLRGVVIADSVAARGVIGCDGDSGEDVLEVISLLLELRAWDDDVTSEANVTCLLLF